MNKLKKILKRRLWETLAVIFAALMVVMCVASQAIVPFNNEISEFFGTHDYEEVKVSPEKGESEKLIDRGALKTAEEIEEYYRAVNVAVEGEGLVLLKNENNALPLARDGKVSFALSGSAKIFYATHGPGVRRQGKLIDLKEAIETNTDMTVNNTIYNFLSTGAGKTGRGITNGVFMTNEAGWNAYTNANLKEEYKNSGDAVIAVITRESGEGVDISYKGSDGIDGSYLSLTAQELEVLEGLAQMKRTGDIGKIIVLINSAVTLECDFLFNDNYGIDAAMWIGLPGATGMNAVAKALVGDINPSGKLSDTFLNDNFSSPAAMYWAVNDGFSSSYENTEELALNNSQEYYGVYAEGIYVGYRYYETRYEDYVMKRACVGNYDYSADVAYPFGYGLSYAQFDYSDFEVEEVKDASGRVTAYNAKVIVTNTGAVAGKEAVQIYLQKPYSEYSMRFGVEKASVELAGFGKTKVLQPGESQTLAATIDGARDIPATVGIYLAFGHG